MYLCWKLFSSAFMGIFFLLGLLFMSFLCIHSFIYTESWLIHFHTVSPFSCARGSPKRQILYEKAGHFQVLLSSFPQESIISSLWEVFHLLHDMASDRRHKFYKKFWQVPYLEDPNTGVQMFESAEIVEYIKATYAVQ